MGTGKKKKGKLPLTKQTSVPCPVPALEQRKLNWEIRTTHANISSFLFVFCRIPCFKNEKCSCQALVLAI